MQRTEQQQKIEKALLELISITQTPMLKNGLDITFIPERYASRDNGNRRKSESYIRENKAHLVLVEPINENNLDEWTDAIAMCYNHLDKLEEIQSHKLNHPLFFESIQDLVAMNMK